ncbi:hypothetical protein [Haloarcula amylolytica]|uniref:Uncharacterized protein n=1 Tax=Haloarcula amylolytica JCM 13557 TaxID=1227452 RepID=M0K562_9EURY|nr:hypothetical protein [Haloarcula amylolytica]EMA15958.1 hypothetical protein C442_18489 [Haloarcula amylolytica JCM 13557]
MVVVDVEKLTTQLYIADMGHVSDLIDYHHVGPHIMMQSDTPEEAIEQYQENITKVETPADIAASLQTDISHTELIIDGNVPPAAIVSAVE